MNAIKLQPFKTYNEEVRPPHFVYESNNGYIEPNDDHAISWYNGVVLSRYGDDVWDLSPYGKTDSKINFSSIIGEIQKKEAKRLSFLYLTYGSGKGKTLPGGITATKIFTTTIKPLALFAQHIAGTINDILKNKKLLRSFILKTLKYNSYRAKNLKTILSLLENISTERSGFTYNKNKNNTKILNVFIQKYTDSLEQTLLIPVSIYSSAAKSRWEHIAFIEKYLHKLIAFIVDYSDHRAFGYSLVYKLDKEELPYHVPWEQAVAKHDIEELFDKYQISNRRKFQRFIAMLQGTCRHLIHQYTGMRNSECGKLSHDCWQEKTTEIPSRIFGKETKLRGVPTKQVWITHDEIKRVIDILNAIGEPMRNKVCPLLKKSPLMIRPSLLSAKEILNPDYDSIAVGRLFKEGKNKSIDDELPLDIEGITITKEHIDELSCVDDRDWDQHEWVREGEKWRFSSHQYRRSLAVYSLGSGLVSLHAIKEQFGHLISAMTAYYGSGHKSARRLDGSMDDKNHIARYMISIKHEIKFYSYRKNVLLSKTPLWGSNGLHLEKHIVAKTPEEREIVIQDSSELKGKFKKGLIDYQDTAMGGCLNPQCAKFLLPDFFISCKGCEHAIHKLEKIDRLAEKQRKIAMRWADIHPDGIDHRTAVALAVEMENFANVLRRKENKEREIV
jgi:integrase